MALEVLSHCPLCSWPGCQSTWPSKGCGVPSLPLAHQGWLWSLSKYRLVQLEPLVSLESFFRKPKDFWWMCLQLAASDKTRFITMEILAFSSAASVFCWQLLLPLLPSHHGSVYLELSEATGLAGKAICSKQLGTRGPELVRRGTRFIFC